LESTLPPRQRARVQELMVGLKLDRIKYVLEFCEPFETETQRLQGEGYPTLPFALLSCTRLKKHCEPNPEDDTMMRRLRQRGMQELSKRMVIQDQHKLATFLWPQFRQMSMLDDAERKRVRTFKSQLITTKCEV